MTHYMRRVLLTTALLLSMLGSRAQSLLGEGPRIITAYLRSIQANYRTVYDGQRKLALIVRNMEGGDAVYYFKDDTCTSYAIVRHGLCYRDVAWSLDQAYRRDGNVWCYDAENAYITLAEAGGSVFINILGTHN